MVTLKDISRETGISVTQVSRALGGHTDVNLKTRQTVEETARRMGYRPNLVARGLKTGRSGIVAMVAPSTIGKATQDIMFEIVIGLSTEMSRQGLKFVLYVCQPGEDPVDAHEELFRGGGIDAFVVTLASENDPRIARLLKFGIPHVVHGTDPAVSHPGADVDNFSIARNLGNHLIGLGHRRILFINGPKGLLFSDERERGLQSVMAEAGLSQADVVFGEMIVERGENETIRALSAAEKPTAIIAGNPMIAAGVYVAAKKLGLSIPGDLSVLGHDDGLRNFEFAAFDPPLGGTLSTLAEAWVFLAEQLDLTIRMGPDKVGGRIVPYQFVDAESTAVPRD